MLNVSSDLNEAISKEFLQHCNTNPDQLNHKTKHFLLLPMRLPAPTPAKLWVMKKNIQISHSNNNK